MHIISIDVLALLDAPVDPNADDATLLARVPDALIALAADAGATFTNVVVLDPTRDARFGTDVAVRFDATPVDIARYCDAYDAADAIVPF